MVAELESARRDWAEGYRRLRNEPDRSAADRLHEQVDVVTAELRRRVGGSFTTAELVLAYRDAERWGRAAVEESAPVLGWPRTLATAIDAAFHIYARGATDYEP